MHQITLTVSQNVPMYHIIEINNNFTACVQSVRHEHASQTVAPLVNRSLDNVLFKVKPSLGQAFLQVIDVTNLSSAYALLHIKTPSNFIIYKSISMKHVRYVFIKRYV